MSWSKFWWAVEDHWRRVVGILTALIAFGLAIALVASSDPWALLVGIAASVRALILPMLVVGAVVGAGVLAVNLSSRSVARVTPAAVLVMAGFLGLGLSIFGHRSALASLRGWGSCHVCGALTENKVRYDRGFSQFYCAEHEHLAPKRMAVGEAGAGDSDATWRWWWGLLLLVTQYRCLTAVSDRFDSTSSLLWVGGLLAFSGAVHWLTWRGQPASTLLVLGTVVCYQVLCVAAAVWVARRRSGSASDV